jgi:hypothetical protein
VNPGGEPERDDTGLPPVDIEIPDDARELERDMQAYRRELRALRRSERRGRWHRWLGKDGIVLPLLACCLILALITGTLLTVFTATSGPNTTGVPGSATFAPSATPEAEIVPMKTLPDASIFVDGSIPVDQLDEAMVVLVPARCGCAATFRWLAEVASKAGVPAYLTYAPGAEQETEQFYRQLDTQVRGSVLLAGETDNGLSAAQGEADIPASQLTAILVGPNSAAAWVSRLSPRDNPRPLVRVLTGKLA